MSTTLVVVLVKVEVSYGPQSPELSGQYLLFYFIFWIKEVMKWLGNLGNSIVLGLDLVVSLLSLSFLFIVLLFYFRSVFHMEENNLRA